ncbi:MAG: ABC transporter permease [Bacteroidota bacterium]
MNKMLVVAKWEYLEKIKSKIFIVSLFLTPALMLAFGILPSLFASRPDTETKIIGIIDQSGQMIAPLSKRLEEKYKLPNKQPNYLLREIIDPDTFVAKRIADSLAIHEDIEGYVIISKSFMTDASEIFRSPNTGNIKLIERLNRAIQDVVTEKKLVSRGIDTSALKDITATMELKTIKISKTGKEEEGGFEKVFIPAYIFMMVMFFVVISSGQLLVRSMMEEKSNRIIEVLVSSCSTTDLMVGKILGLSGLGLTQLAVWGFIGATFALSFLVSVLTVTTALLLFMYFILGYLFYAALFVALGAPVSTEQEAQQLTSYLVMLLIVPMVLIIPIMESPNSLMVKILSYIPLLTPTMMAMRIAGQMPSPFELITTMIVLGVSAVLAMWAAGKIFRVTILVVGKRPSLGELIRIVKST